MKTVLGTIAGLIGWFVLVTVIGGAMRASWPAYAAVADAMTFTLPMMIARLTIGAASLLIAAAIAARIAPGAATGWAIGIVLLVMFVPIHVGIWDRFPIWYHLTFLLTLVPLSLAGSRLASRH